MRLEGDPPEDLGARGGPGAQLTTMAPTIAKNAIAMSTALRARPGRGNAAATTSPGSLILSYDSSFAAKRGQGAPDDADATSPPCLITGASS